ncbi:hypothetical protein AO501_23335 [Mycobacterium gordonae]|uniref:Uncharacterized protein n=1 Tax=Mycobacterium gordonae TaxID=1778 RepID=A0A0Q2LM42_MYCGO|nr:hypothetical protein AO501_23335 [Mycobacterium gordonae]
MSPGSSLSTGIILQVAWEDADLADARRVLHKDIFAVVQWAIDEKQFRLRKQGHAFALYCPCGGRNPFIRVDGTPRNPTWKAKTIRRSVNRCPDQHELMGLQ